MASKQQLRSLALFSFSDADFLMIVDDNGDDDGYVTTQELAAAIFGATDQDLNRNVGSRLSWMRRFGVIERDEQPGSPTRGAWRLNDTGVELVRAQLKAAQLRTLEQLSEGELWNASQVLTDNYGRAGDATANLVRRALMVGFHQRRRR